MARDRNWCHGWLSSCTGATAAVAAMGLASVAGADQLWDLCAAFLLRALAPQPVCFGPGGFCRATRVDGAASRTELVFLRVPNLEAKMALADAVVPASIGTGLISAAFARCARRRHIAK